MKNMDIQERLKKIIIRVRENSELQIDDQKDFHLINDIGFDSLQVINLVVEVENEFGFVFDDNEMEIDIICQYSSLVKLIREELDKQN